VQAAETSRWYEAEVAIRHLGAVAAYLIDLAMARAQPGRSLQVVDKKATTRSFEGEI